MYFTNILLHTIYMNVRGNLYDVRQERTPEIMPLTHDTEARLRVLCKQITLRLQELVGYLDACVVELNGNTTLHARDLGPLWQGVASRTRSRVGVPRRCKVHPVAAHGTAERTFPIARELGWVTENKGDLFDKE